MANKLLTPEERTSRLIIAAAVFVVFLVGILIIVFSHKPTVVFHPETVRQGYESSPATYTVEASPHKKFSDYWSGGGFVAVWVGFILAVGGSYWYFTWTNSRAKTGTWIGVAGFVVAGALLIFGSYAAMQGNVRYATTLTAPQYEQAKDNLDAIFPTSK
jgi:hypothetical protein